MPNNTKTLKTRIVNKHAALSEWQAATDFTLKEGEIALAKVTIASTGLNNEISQVPAYIIKVGVEGQTYTDSAWAYAKAVDVYAWAKQANLPVTCIDSETNEDGSGKGNVISAISFNPTTKQVEYTTATVATSEGLADLTDRVSTIEQLLQIETTDVEGTETKVSVVITDFETRISANETAIAALDLQINGKPAQGTPDTEDYVEAVLGLKDTKADKSYVDETFTTPGDVTNIVEKAIADVSDTDAIEGITNLVTYVNEHGADLTAIIKEVYGDSITDIPEDGVSRIDTAISDSSTAKSDASEALRIANEASEKVNADTESAQAAAQAAEEAKENASNYALEAYNYAHGLETDAESYRTMLYEIVSEGEHAKQDAESARDEAQGYATSARESETNALSARYDAESARDEAVSAKEEAVSAKEEAVSAKDEAVSARDEIVASNTSATSIANEAKTTADAAKSTADEAKSAADSAIGAVIQLAARETGSFDFPENINSQADVDKLMEESPDSVTEIMASHGGLRIIKFDNFTNIQIDDSLTFILDCGGIE